MSIVVQRISNEPAPEDECLIRWLQAALPQDERREVVVRIVDDAESQTLNKQWRDKDKPTNVLSFPAEPLPLDLPELAAEAALGDLVVCAPVVNREAEQQNKAPEAHWAHMMIHGCLHLQGFDHQNDTDAEQMEALERRLLADLNFPDPYIVKDQ